MIRVYSFKEVLPSPNSWSNAHWSLKYKLKKKWYMLLLATFGVAPENERGKKRKIKIVQYRIKQYIMDEGDNLKFSVKYVVDIFKEIIDNRKKHMKKGLGWIVDDCLDWFELEVEQVKVNKKAEQKTVIFLKDCC